MSNKKQNSVEWLMDEILKAKSNFEWLKIFEQAKAMHRNEIEEAVNSTNKKWESSQTEFILNGKQYYEYFFKGQDNETHN